MFYFSTSHPIAIQRIHRDQRSFLLHLFILLICYLPEKLSLRFLTQPLTLCQIRLTSDSSLCCSPLLLPSGNIHFLYWCGWVSLSG